MPHEYSIRRRVEFSETDMAGVVHFSQFFRYMEAVEHAFFRSLGASVVMELEGQSYGWPRVHAECDYRRPLRFEDEFEARLTVREIRGRALVLDFTFTRIGEEAAGPVATGSLTTVCVIIDPKGQMRSVAIPPAFADKIEPAPATRT